MGIFSRDEDEHFPGIRKVGFARYRELLEANWKAFMIVGFYTLVFFIPFAGGMVYAILSKSLLIALAAGVIGGAIAGPGLACMYDLILRRMRNDLSDWWFCWKKAFRQNWRAAILPGIVQCAFTGMIVFAGALMLWGASKPSLGTLALMLFGSLILIMIITVWWAQLVLFSQKTLIMLKNSLFFAIFHFWRMLGMAALRTAWWLIMFLFLPWTGFVVPFLGIWYILFLSLSMIYRALDKDFRVEEQIREAFPGTLPEEEYIP
ncbi:MAG: hypothetical protein IKP26_08835 [Clostridia bacterium]|nr:hypothetical protein [Clostridia bacterium]